jgi:hypothetical protein
MAANGTAQTRPVHESLSSTINYTYLVKHNYSLNLSSSVMQGKIAINMTDPRLSFYGAVVTLNAQYNFYVVYNNSVPNNFPLIKIYNQTSFVFYTNAKSVNFTALNATIDNSSVPIGSLQVATLSYVLNYDNQGEVMVEIANLSLKGSS